MSFQDMAWAVDQKCNSAGQKLVLLMLANYSNSHTGQCNPSHKRLASDCSMGLSTLKRNLESLQADGFLTVIHKSQEGVSLPNQYRLALHKLDGVGPNRAGGGSDLGGGVGPIWAGGGSDLGGGVGPIWATNQEVKPVIKPVKGDPVGFASFWSVYPKKTAKPSAERAFKAAKLKAGELDSILRDIETRKQSDDWKKESGRYVPNPSTYLNNKRWQDGETAHTSTFAKVMVGAV